MPRSESTPRRTLHAAFAALAATPEGDVGRRVADIFAPGAAFHGPHPINDITGPAAIAEAVWSPLIRSFRFLRRDDDFFTCGTFKGETWISAFGNLHGVFVQDYLGIPATQNWAWVRYGEFHQVENGKIVRSHVIFDLPELMRQAGALNWQPGPGVPGLQPGPASRDGLLLEPQDPAESRRSLDLVEAMIFEGFVAADMHTDPSWMQRYWTEDMRWYGPGMIGAAMGMPGFYRFHETPWETAFATRGPRPTRENKHVTRFGDGVCCSFTGWPSIYATHVGDFLGLSPTGRDVEIRVMDFYHRRGDRLDENWVFIDMPHLFLQLGVDLFARMADVRGRR